MKRDFMFTSQSVTEGHPDKVCDQISDAVVDHFLEHDPHSMIRAECAVATSILFIAARFASKARVDFAHAARKVIRSVGYEEEDFNSRTCSILTSIKELPVDDYCRFNEEELTEEELDALPVRNQDTIFGFACNQTPALMPLPIWLAHKLAMQLARVRHERMLPYLAPDGKTQVGVAYRDCRPHRIHSITISASRKESASVSLQSLHDDIRQVVIDAAFRDEVVKPDDDTQILVNPVGVVMLGGPAIHSGLTGRKNGTDTYGEYSRYSGSALSGKDPLRIDRVGVYAARHAAKNVVAAGLAEECEVQLSYTIGRSRPVSIQVDTFGTGKLEDERIAALVEEIFDFRLGAILRRFRLRFLPAQVEGGFYRKLAAYGQVGRMDMELPWEATDEATLLQERGRAARGRKRARRPRATP
jgi:S-adenosylmethionine synthetase